MRQCADCFDVQLSGLLSATLLVAVAATAGCTRTELRRVGTVFVVEAAGANAYRLFVDAGGDRRLLDEQVVSWRVYGTCLLYERRGGDGVAVLAVADDARQPYEAVPAGSERPWHLEANGLRRYRHGVDESGAAVVFVDALGDGALCTRAAAQPTLDGEAATFSAATPEVRVTVASLKDIDDVGTSALHAAARTGPVGLVGALIEAGLSPAKVNAAGDTPLHVAAAFNHADVVQRLLDAAAPVDVPNARGMTPLMYAARHHAPGPARLLLAAGASATRPDHAGKTAVTLARESRATEVLAAIERGVTPR